MKYEFVVEGLPVGKQRPRATVFGGHARIYTPSKTTSYEALVRGEFKQQCGNILPLDGAVKVEIQVYYQLEKKHYLKRGINAEGIRKLNGELFPTKKPDPDNIAKSIMDALNSVAYKDDSQVVSLIVFKRYIDGASKVLVTIQDI